MSMSSRFVLALIALLLAAHTAVAHAQPTLTQLQEELIAPWLVTVQGGDRSLLLRINEISRSTDGSLLVNANFGWIDGPQTIVRVELIQSPKDLLLVIRTNRGSLYSVRRTPNGDFVGTYKPERGEEKGAKLEKLSDSQIPQKVQESTARMVARVFADEDKDWGVAAAKAPRTKHLHAPTPKELPGAKTIRTMELKALLGKLPAPILIDVLGGNGHRTIPGAHWLREPGEASFGNAERDRFRQDLEKLTAGRSSAALVFFCLSSECWMSYNAGLRAMELGYTNVYWYRGGTVAWRRADFATTEAEPYRR